MQFSSIYCLHSIVQPPPLSGSKTSPSPQKGTLALSSHSPYPFSSIQKAVYLHFVSMDLPLLDISYEWNQTVFDRCFQLLLLSIMPSRFIHLTACIRTSFPSHGWIIFYCMDALHIVYPFICWQTFGLCIPFSYCK